MMKGCGWSKKNHLLNISKGDFCANLMERHHSVNEINKLFLLFLRSKI